MMELTVLVSFHMYIELVDEQSFDRCSEDPLFLEFTVKE